MSTFPNLITDADADAWPSTITVTQTYDYTSSDGGLTKTGTATFTYTRATLADVLAHPKLFFDLGHLLPPGDGKFLPVRYALGKMPGWAVLFGTQPTQAGAFTVTSTPTFGPPLTTHEDADCLLSLNCLPCAPGRRAYVDPDADNGFLGINGGVQAFGALKMLVAYTVEQIFGGAPATETAAEVGPVYRVTIPEDVSIMFDGGMTIVRNGETITIELIDGRGDTFYIGSGVLGGAVGGDLRSPWVCEVQMPHFGDTLAAGTISYFAFGDVPPSYLSLSPGGRVPLDDPFHLAPVSYPRDENGLSIGVTF